MTNSYSNQWLSICPSSKTLCKCVLGNQGRLNWPINNVVASLMAHILCVICTSYKWWYYRVAIHGASPFYCELLHQLLLERQMRQRLFQQPETHITVNYPRIAYRCVKQIKKQMVPPFVASGETTVNSTQLISCVNATYVLCVLQVHWTGSIFLPWYFSIHKLFLLY